ncbi:MAG: hypothetical protein ACYC49_16640 [Ignavibacteriaceae bacterium]
MQIFQLIFIYLSWLPGIVIAIGNGSLRQFVYNLFFDELEAHQLSVLSFIIFFGIYVWLILPWLKLSSTAEAIRVGVFWLTLTIIFEFIFGHFVMDHPWKDLFHDYNLLSGRLWVIVLLWTAISPYLFFRLRS